MNRVVLFFTVVVTVVLLLFSVQSQLAAQVAPVDNVILITIDGLRWQELFGGADQRLINKEDGQVDDPVLTRATYWHDEESERRRLLMPFFWEQIASQGQVFGSPAEQSLVRVTNGHYFSYPGYNEILTGFGDPKIDSNDKVNNPNVTVLEWLNRMPEYQGRVAAFCSWDVFPFIINSERSGIPVNAGWQPLEHFELESDKRQLNRLAEQLPRYWQSVRYDAFTFRGATEYLKKFKPRVLYLALGETDDWAHAGRYDLYLDAAKSNDDFIRQLWELTEQIDQYRGKTAFVITTDHGRGDDREGWKSHGKDLPGCDRIWVAVLGPSLADSGLRQGVQATQGQVAATVAMLLGKDFTMFDSRITQPLPLEPASK